MLTSRSAIPAGASTKSDLAQAKARLSQLEHQIDAQRAQLADLQRQEDAQRAHLAALLDLLDKGQAKWMAVTFDYQVTP